MRGEEKDPGFQSPESVLITSSLFFSVLPEQETGLAKDQSLVERENSPVVKNMNFGAR